MKRTNATKEQGRTFPRDDLIDIPGSATVHWIFISIDFLLSERPVRELITVTPQRHPRRDMYESEVTTLTLDGLAFVSAIQGKLEKCIVVTRKVIPRPGGEFLVGGHKGRCDIVS